MPPPSSLARCSFPQAELDLTRLMLSPSPMPLDAALPIIQRDPHTGEAEPDVYGYLGCMSWLGARSVAAGETRRCIAAL